LDRVKRRQALQQLGFGLSAGLLAPSWLTACTKEDFGPEVPYDGNVAIIGGGPAGLYAADILTSKGINVMVLEASAQLGGRVRSLRNQRDIPNQTVADFPVELGAEIIYGTNSALSAIISNLTLDTINLNTAAVDRFVLDNQAKNAVDWQRDADFQAVQNFAANLQNITGGGSVQQAANVSTRARALLNARVGNNFGTSSDRLGAAALAESLKLIPHDNVPYTLRANPMQDVIISRFTTIRDKVQLNSPVKSVNYSANPIVMTLQDGTQLQATKVIVAVPLAILKKGGIVFSPPLPAFKTAALNSLDMDACVRVVLDFKKNFWGEDAGYIWGGTTAPQYFSAGVGRSQFYRTLSITVCGPKAAELSALGADMITPILSELDSIYNGQATAFIRRDLNTNQIISFIQDWTKEEFIQGGFSYAKPGATNQTRIDLAAPVSGKLFFAGEATDIVGEAGTVSGALNSAERVSDDVIKTILGVS